jgi:DNA/RNA-binding domain of Phe-tRNA-synthetase-like protein
MSFVVSQECVRLGLRAGAAVFRGVRVAPAGPELRAAVVREAAAVRGRYAGTAAVRSDPRVAAFHEVLRRAGVNPRRDQPSIDRLLTYALKRGDLPAVNALVDAYNLVSIRSVCSLGAHDLDRIALPVSLQVLSEPAAFTPLGGAPGAVVNAGEYAYVDAGGAVLCRLDVVQADFSKVTADTGNALLIIEGTAAHPPEALRQAFADAVEEVLRHCGGTAEVVAFPDPGGPAA